MNKIISIEETEWKEKFEDNSWYIENKPRISYTDFEGFIIKTESEEIRVGIDSEHQCCEQAGYLITEEKDLKYFIGADLINVYETSEDLTNVEIPVSSDWDQDEIRTFFVTIETDKGTFQFVAYNAQNGYYGHHVRIVRKNLSDNSETIETQGMV